jgi:hypothetical protein
MSTAAVVAMPWIALVSPDSRATRS